MRVPGSAATTPAAKARGTAALPITGPAVPPPFRLTATHFFLALAWFVAASAGLVAAARELAAGNFLAPRALAVTHAFTLGMLTTTIFGALNQFFPGALGIAIRSVRAAWWALAFHSAGTAALVAGFWWWRPPLLAAGWVLLFIGIFLTSRNLLPQRRRAPHGLVVGRYVAAGHVALGTALLVAGVRIGNMLGWWPADRLDVLAAHAHLAAFGFVVFTAVGVGSWLMPLFLLAARAPTWPLRWIGPVGMTGLALLTAGELGDWRIVTVGGGALVVASALLYLTQLALYFRHRERRGIDAAMAHVAVGVLHLAAATALGAAILAGASSPRLWAAYGLLAIVGWLVLLVVGVMYKLFPFLLWMNLVGPHAVKAGGPTQADLSSVSMVWLSLGCLTAGVWALAAGTLAGQAGLATPGAVLLLGGAIVVVGQYARIVVRVRRWRLSAR